MLLMTEVGVLGNLQEEFLQCGRSVIITSHKQTQHRFSTETCRHWMSKPGISSSLISSTCDTGAAHRLLNNKVTECAEGFYVHV